MGVDANFGRIFARRVIVSKLRLFLFSLAVLLSAHCAPVLAAEKVQALIGIRNMDESQAPFIVAKYLGYFSQEGLDVDLLNVGGSNEIAIQVGSGNANIGAASPSQAVISMQENVAASLDVRYYYCFAYSNIWTISVPEGSSIKTIAELRGKKIGVPSFGSGGLTYGKAYVRSAGLDPEKDVTFIPIGSGSQAASAIRQKVVDAVAFWNVANARFELSGLPLRDLDIGEKFEALPDLSLLAKNDTIKNNPKMLIGFARAVSKAIDFTRANPAAAVYITWKVYPESRSKEADPQKALAEGLKILQVRSPSWTSPKTHGKNGLFLEDDWKSLSDFLLAGGQIAKPVPTSRIYTNDLIDQINDYDRNAVIQQAKNFDIGSIR